MKESKTIKWNGDTFSVKTALGLKQMLSFVSTVVNSCFEKDTGAYMPEVFSFAVDRATVEFYTDYALPQDVSKMYELLTNSDLVEAITSHINTDQYNGMVSSAGEKCRHIADMLIDGVAQRVEEFIDGFKDLENLLRNAVEGVDDGLLKSVLSEAAGFRFDEKKLVKAIFDEKEKESGDTIE